MMGEAGALGDLGLATASARAVEPTHGETRDGVAHGACLNCGTALVGDYCHACGQQGHVHRSVGAIWHDIAHGVLHAEGKTFRTLPLLAWRPGQLTRRYIEGERARFVSPMALFLFSIFLMFAVIQAMGGSLHTPDVSPEAKQAATRDLEQALARNAGQIERAEAERAAARTAGQPTGEIDERLTSLEGERRGIGSTLAVAKAATSLDFNGEAPIDTGWKRLDKGLSKARANPNLALYKVQTNAYKFSWALIPISVPFVWLMFAWRRRFHVYDHAVFVTYSLSFMTLFGIVLTLLSVIGFPSGPLAALVTLVPPIHMYRQLKGGYGLSRFGALWRTAALLIFAFWAMIIFFSLLLAMGALG